MRRLALRELIRQANSGRVQVTIPLPRSKLSLGPLSLDLTGGHAAVIELEVEGARVLRKKTKGTIDPPISLPLGLTFAGLYLNEHGEVIADISSFPDVNLSRWSAQVPQIPATLDRVLDLLFPEEEKEAPEATETSEAPGSSEDALDLSGLVVVAHDVRPRCAEPLSLGVGQVMLAEDTCIDVEYGPSGLVIRGRAAVKDAHLEGQGFNLHGVSAQGEGGMEASFLRGWNVPGGDRGLPSGGSRCASDRTRREPDPLRCCR